MIIIKDLYTNMIIWTEALNNIKNIKKYNLIIEQEFIIEMNNIFMKKIVNIIKKLAIGFIEIELDLKRVKKIKQSIKNYNKNNELNDYLKLLLNNHLKLARLNYYDKIKNTPFYYPLSVFDISIISNKLSLGLLLKETDIHPNIYTSCESLLKYEKQDKLWFIKNAQRDCNNDTICLRTNDIKKIKLNPGYIIQEGITDLDLYNNKKYTIRVIILLHNKKMYFYKKYWSYLHIKDYNSYSPDIDIHTDSSRGKSGGSLEIIYVNNEDMSNAIYENLKIFKKYIKKIINKTNKYQYKIIEGDFLYTTYKKAILIEINSIFSINTFCINRSKSIDNSISIECFENIIKCIVGLPYDKNLKKI